LLTRNYQLQKTGQQMGDFNSYFFFAAAAGLMAAAIAIAMVSAFLHLREGTASVSKTSTSGSTDVAPTPESGLARSDDGIVS
jgi:hypothetical protein